MRIMSPKRAVLAVLLAICCLAGGCNSVKDAWNTRGVPRQWEPDGAGASDEDS